MLTILSMVAPAATTAVLVVKIVLAVLALASAVFIITVVMMQSGNSDGMDAMMGSSNKNDDSETYYGKNSTSRRDARLKLWTYICAGVLAVCCIVFLILGLL